MATITITKRNLFQVLLALKAYEKVLLEDEEDPGPSQADALLISHLAKTLRAEYEKAEE